MIRHFLGIPTTKQLASMSTLDLLAKISRDGRLNTPYTAEYDRRLGNPQPTTKRDLATLRFVAVSLGAIALTIVITRFS